MLIYFWHFGYLILEAKTNIKILIEVYLLNYKKFKFALNEATEMEYNGCDRR